MTDYTQLKRVVVYRLGSLGDTIVALPCFHHIARTMPQAERVVLTNIPVSSKAAPLEGILGGSGLIHRTMAYPVGTRSIKALWRLRHQLKALHTDTLVYLTPGRGLKATWRDVLYFRLCGFKHIIGAPVTHDLQHNRAINEEGAVERECVRLARCLSTLGPIDLHDAAMWDLRLQDSERQTALQAIAPLSGHTYIAINMGGKLAKNDWGMDNWVKLLKQLSSDHPAYGLLVVGGAEDSLRAQRVAQIWSGPVVDACGQLSPRESAAAMQGARCFIGHDSGPLHLAAAMNVPCLGLFGDNNPPQKWHPIGPAHRLIHRMQGVLSITVDEALHAAQSLCA